MSEAAVDEMMDRLPSPLRSTVGSGAGGSDSGGSGSSGGATVAGAQHPLVGGDGASLMLEVLDHVSEAVATFDRHGRLSVFNRAFVRLAGPVDHPITPGMSVQELLHAFTASPCARCRAAILSPPAADGAPPGHDRCEHVIGQAGAVDVRRFAIAEGGFVVIISDATRRRRDQEALQASAKSLANAQRIAHLGNWDLDVATNEFVWSDEIFRVFGLRAQQFTPTYDDFLDAVHPDDRGRVRDAVEAALYRDAPYDIEHRIVRPDGAVRIVAQSGEVIFTPEGVPWRMTGTVQDITERKLAERALAEVKERFRLAFEISPDAISISRLRDGAYVDVNEGYTTLTGFPREEVVGKPAAEIGFWHDPAERARLVRHLLDKDVVKNLEITVRHRSGALRTALLSASRFELNGEGHLLAVTKDITELQAAIGEARRLSQAVEQSPSPVIITGPDGVIEYVNPTFTETTGYSREDVLGTTPKLLRSGNTPPERYRKLRETVLAGDVWHGEFENRRKDGTRFWVRTSISAIRNEDGEVTHFVGVEEDITERRIAEERLRASEERFRGLVEGSLLGIVIDEDGRPVFANRTYARLFGFDEPEQILALKSLDALYVQEDLDMIRRYRRSRRSGEYAPEDYEFRGIRKDGQQIWLRAHIRHVSWNDRPAVQSTLVDITLSKSYEERLHQQANYDPVTRLPNRVLAMDRLKRAIARAKRHAGMLSVLFIDLDRFKAVNDSFGHTVGDLLLQEVAARIVACVREDDTVARLGGDEFIVILADEQGGLDAEAVGRKILGRLAKPFDLSGHEVLTSASIGVSIWPGDGGDPQDLLRKADAAMYQAKERGRNAVAFFTRALDDRVVERNRLEAELRGGLESNELALLYQPIVEAGTGRAVGVEAFLRWNSPLHGSLAPGQFMTVAETTGLVVPVGQWVLRTACRQLRIWRTAGLRHLRLCVNISGRQLREPEFVGSVLGVLDAQGLPPDCLELDVAEGLLIEDNRATRAALEALKSHGVGLALDDFGTGYCALSALHKSPIDTVKIDASVIETLPNDSASASLAEAIIAMAHRLDLKVVAEGVELQDQLEFLRSRQCDEAQGYLFGKPVEAGALLGSGLIATRQETIATDPEVA